MKIEWSRDRLSRILRSLFAAACLTGVVAYASLRSDPPTLTGSLFVKVVGTDYRWKYIYAGEDQRLNTSDDLVGSQNLIAPAGREVCLQLTSDDFVYLLEIPEVDVYELAAPGLGFDVQFSSPPTGSYALLGSQMCGYDHPDLMGQMIVKSSRDFDRAMRELSKRSNENAK